MGEHLFELLRGYFNQYGYWTVAVALLLENAGLPVPGETVLLFASFLAYSERELRLPYIILMGIWAATVGDNIGYAIGLYGGRPLLGRYQHTFRIRQATIARGERLIEKHGRIAIFFARFIFGMRVIAGPLAGVLRMPWKQFLIFNFLGAVLWVTVIAVVGYVFGSRWQWLLELMRRVDIALLIVATAVAIFWWRALRRKRNRQSD